MDTGRDKDSGRFGRRRFLTDTSVLAAASVLGVPLTAAAEPPPETRRLRLVKVPAYCLAPEYLAEELLRLEGFSEIEYATLANPAPSPMTSQKAESISA